MPAPEKSYGQPSLGFSHRHPLSSTWRGIERFVTLTLFGALSQELNPHERFSKDIFLAVESQISCQEQTKEQMSMCVLGHVSSLPHAVVFVQGWHRCTAGFLRLLGWSSVLGLVVMFTSK